MFFKNVWYVVVWDYEVSCELKFVIIFGEKIVFYCWQNGQVVVLEDVCFYCKLLFFMGCIKGDDVECGYYGLIFDCLGICICVLGVECIFYVVKVCFYFVYECYGLFWVWMGEVEKVDLKDIFEVEYFDDLVWGINCGEFMMFNCNYFYMIDNLFDLFYVVWVY